MKVIDKAALVDWEAYRESIIKNSPVPKETVSEQKKRINYLLSHFPDFCKYYFYTYCTAEFAPFQIDIVDVVMGGIKKYLVVKWCRDCGKSVIIDLFLPVFRKFNGKSKNTLLLSWCYDNAERLLMPLKIQLESNPRIINDFGIQKGLNQWQNGNFITRDGYSYLAVGAGQNPRGNRNENIRPDTLLFDDMDNDEVVKNIDRLNEQWDWIEGAVIPTLSVSGDKLILFVGNQIAEDCIIARALKMADYTKTITLLDKKGQPSWKEKNSLEQCMWMIDHMTYRISQREYFHNFISQGKIFKNINYKPILPLHKYKIIVTYIDPSWKSGPKSDYKAIVMIGFTGTEYHVLKCYMIQDTPSKMFELLYDLHDWVGDKVSVSYYMESSFMQDILFDTLIKVGIEKGWQFPLRPDDRKKPDKYLRVESIEPYFFRGLFYFNEADKENVHMKKLIEQFLLFDKKNKAPDDGPDACEGAIWMINHKTFNSSPIIVLSKHVNKYRI